MKKFKNIVISNYDDIKNPDYAGGGAIAVFKLARHLSKKYKVTLVTGKYPGAKNEIVNGIKYKRIGSYLLGGKLGHLFYLMALPLACIKEKCDLWIDSLTPPFSASIVPLLVGNKKVIGLVHMLSASDMKRKYKLPFDIVEKFGLRFYKYFIVMTEETGKEILKSNPNAKISIIPNGVDIPSEKLLTAKKKNQILFIGRVEINQKGLDLLLQVFKRVLVSFRYRLIIAGSGLEREMQELKSLVKFYDLGKKVKFVGWVEGEEKYKLIRESQAVIVPSRYETFGMSALDALANKTVLVSFDIEGLKWIPEEISIKVKAFDVNMMADKITQIFKNASLRNRFQESGYEFSFNYSFERMFSSYDRVIKNILR